ncbi:MAG: AsmA family protein, partial [Gammaproteobacteria bacterium]|nr:AsmA family protein [Gammaproteobacteria bacterium]
SLRFDPKSQTLEVKDVTGRGRFQEVAGALSVPALAANFVAKTYTAPSIVFDIEHEGPPTRITIPELDVDLSKQTANAGALQLDGPDGRVDAEVSATGIIDAPAITAKLVTQDFNLRSLLQRIAVPLDTADPLALQRVSIDTQISTEPEKVDISALTATIDDTQIDGTLAISGLPDARYQFDLKIGELDMDRYLPPVSEGGSETPADETNAAAAVVLPLAMLRNLSIDGELRAERLKSKGLSVSNLAISVQSRDGKVALKPIEADLYEGRSEGEIVVNAAADTPRLNVRESLSAIQIGPALHDAGISDKLSGTGNLEVDIAASGVDDMSLKKTMNGDVAFDLKNGAIKGFDIQKIVLRARQAYERAKQREVTADPEAEDETRFSAMSGTLIIDNGIVRNDDLNIKAPVFRISGAGQASLVANQVDYLLDVTLVESIEGQGGADLGDLEGVAIPVRVKGPLDAPRYFVDLGHLLKARANEEIEKEKDKAKKKIEDKLKKKLKGLFD